MTPEKKGIFVRLSDETLRQLDDLRQRLGGNLEVTMTLAIERLYQGYTVADALKECFNSIDSTGKVSLLETDGERHWTSKELTSREGEEHDQPG